MLQRVAIFLAVYVLATARRAFCCRGTGGGALFRRGAMQTFGQLFLVVRPSKPAMHDKSAGRWRDPAGWTFGEI